MTTVHASAVALNDRAALILGTSGSGKSALALDLMAAGCRLVADDRVVLSRRGDALVAEAPETLLGLMEWRGVGLLRCAEPALGAKVCIAVDLDTVPSGRLPDPSSHEVEGIAVPVIAARGVKALASGILLVLQGRALIDTFR
ncbi:MAG: HPr kinase/phosphorylase [Rubricella sp.]